MTICFLWICDIFERKVNKNPPDRQPVRSAHQLPVLYTGVMKRTPEIIPGLPGHARTACMTAATGPDMKSPGHQYRGRQIVSFIGSVVLGFVDDPRKKPVSHLPPPAGGAVRGKRSIRMDIP